jgi:phage baseplate assembly protein gpV
MRIKIVRTVGNYSDGDEFEIDEQIAQQLVTQGIARVVEVVRASDLVTEKAPAPASNRDEVFAPPPKSKKK